MTWVMSGYKRGLQILGLGFDSLPRLHYYEYGRRLGRHVIATWNDPMSSSRWRSFWSGVYYEIWLTMKAKARQKAPSANLAVDKHRQLVKTLTDLSNLREKHIEVSKELSFVKRSLNLPPRVKKTPET